MKALLAGTALAALLGGSALAADLGAPINPFVPQTPVYSWTGLYLGLQGGYGWGDTREVYEYDDGFDRFSSVATFKPKGFVGGGHLGALYQWNWLVIGAEGDIEFNTLDDGITETFFDPFIGPFDATFSVNYNWSASARGRIGVAFDRVLLYGTGGYAFANWDTRLTLSDDLDVDLANAITLISDSEGLSGWTAGGGIDVLVGYNLSARIEYRYTDLEDLIFETNVDTLTIENNFQAVRAGLSYHF